MGTGARWFVGAMLLAASLPLVTGVPPSVAAPALVHPSTINAAAAPQPAPVVYLTFDDGPHPVYTPQILEVLAKHRARSTFFVVGSMVQNWPQTARQIVEAGHSIQLHSWRHANLTKFTREEFTADTTRSQAALEEVVNRRATCMRPPFGAVNSRLIEWAEEVNLKTVMWSNTGADWLDLTSEQIARRVVNGVQPGSVVLLHDGGGNRSRTVSALEIILEELTEAGYRFRPMCSSLPVTQPARACWEFYGWPVARPCTDDSRTPDL